MSGPTSADEYRAIEQGPDPRGGHHVDGPDLRHRRGRLPARAGDQTVLTPWEGAPPRASASDAAPSAPASAPALPGVSAAPALGGRIAFPPLSAGSAMMADVSTPAEVMRPLQGRARELAEMERMVGLTGQPPRSVLLVGDAGVG